MPAPPPQPRLLEPASAAIEPGAGIVPALEAVGEPVRSPLPPTFEELGLAEGLVLHTTTTTLEGQPLSLQGLRDRAVVLVDGALAGVLERDGRTSLPMPEADAARLDLVVETMGRINYGSLLGEHKGITGGVLLERALVHDWTSRALALDEWGEDELRLALAAGGHAPGQPGVGIARLEVAEPLDGWLAVPGAGKAFVWLNGALLGRLWSVGPQRTLYAPAPLWREGENELVVLDLEHLPTGIALVDGPELGEAEEFVERLDTAPAA